MANLAAQGVRTALWFFVIVGMTFMIARGDLATAEAALAAADRFDKAGGYLLVASSIDAALPQIEASACRTLNHLAGVRWAGAMDENGSASIAAAPSWKYRRLQVDIPVARYWQLPETETDRLIAGGVVASEVIGASTGEAPITLSTGEEVTLVAASEPLFHPAASRAIISTPAVRPLVSECWLETDPWAINHLEGPMAVAVGIKPAAVEQQVTLRRWLTPDDFDVSPVGIWMGRPVHVWHGLGIGMLVSWGLINAFTQRRKTALYRTVGWTSTDLIMGDVAAWWIVAIPASAVGVAAAIGLSGRDLVLGAVPSTLLDVAVPLLVGGLVLPTLASLITPGWAVARVLRGAG